MSYKSIARSGAEGNTHLLKSYGGGSSGPRQAYATGGAVRSSPNPALAEGLSAAGGAAKPSLARPGRKMASKAKGKGKKETQINVIVAPAAGDKAPGPVPRVVPCRRWLALRDRPRCLPVLLCRLREQVRDRCRPCGHAVARW